MKVFLKALLESLKCEAFYRKPRIVSKSHNVSPNGSTVICPISDMSQTPVQQHLAVAPDPGTEKNLSSTGLSWPGFWTSTSLSSLVRLRWSVVSSVVSFIS